MRFKLPVIFSFGFFALLAQILLFRDFLTVFQGNELSIGFFFCSWLLWVALGALFAGSGPGGVKCVKNLFEIFLLLYIPAFIFQEHFLLNARSIAGVASYELFPLSRIIPLVFILNAPVSFVTGFLFVAGCKWVSDSFIPVSRVYVVESLGSFAGALSVTFMLAGGFSHEIIILSASAFISFLIMLFLFLNFKKLHYGGYLKFVLSVLFLISTLFFLFAGYGAKWAHRNELSAWEKILPGSEYTDSFTTPQARYLYGEYAGQFTVVSWDSVCETFPDRQNSIAQAALNLSQKPDAGRILVVASGSLALCRILDRMPEIEKVVYLDTDPAYPEKLMKVLPGSLKPGPEVGIPGVELRSYLRTTDQKFDLVILDLPKPSSLVMNRYYTRESFALIKRVMSEGAVMSVAFPGGENFMGPELTYFGASLRATLRSEFSFMALRPGESSVFFVSDTRGVLSSSGEELKKRLESMTWLRTRYPPEDIKSLFPENRIAFQMENYDRAAAESGVASLLNSDREPKAYLYSFLLSLKQLGGVVPGIPFINRLTTVLFPVLLSFVLLLAVLRALYMKGLLPLPGSRKKLGIFISKPEIFFALFAAGSVGMLINIILIFYYQISFGSIFLNFGIVTSLFMLGLFFGGAILRRLLKKSGFKPFHIFIVSFLYIALGVLIFFFPPGNSHFYFALLFFLAGAFCGAYLPLCACQLRTRGMDDGRAGASLEFIDHLAGAAGGLFASTFLLPVAGTAATLWLSVALIAVLLALSMIPSPVDFISKYRTSDRVYRIAAYFMFALAACVVIFSLSWKIPEIKRADMMRSTALDNETISLLRNGEKLSPIDGILTDSGHQINCYTVEKDGKTEGYVFYSEDFAPGIQGYGGPLSILVRASRDGRLDNFKILEHSETGNYLDMVLSHKDVFRKTNIFECGAGKKLDSVSGATISSKAISKILREAGHNFASRVLKKQLGHIEHESEFPWREPLLLVLMLAIAFRIRFKISVQVRTAFLIICFAVLGAAFNLQYSSDRIFALLNLKIPMFFLSPSFILTLVLPLLVIVYRNYYCGYVCPFGAVQELINMLKPKRWRTDPGYDTWRFGRFVKYIILFIFVIFFCTGTAVYGAGDILLYAFTRSYSVPIIIFLILLLVLSFFFRRFWCRNLCPAGAFLALLNGIRFFRHYIPVLKPGRCDLGIRNARELDCINCDRCRLATSAEPGNIREGGGVRNTVFLISVLLCAVFVVFYPYYCGTKRSAERIETPEKTTTKTVEHNKSLQELMPVTGATKKVEKKKEKREKSSYEKKILKLIEQNRLSDREAMFYHRRTE